jgi:hypothetical protein
MLVVMMNCCVPASFVAFHSSKAHAKRAGSQDRKKRSEMKGKADSEVTLFPHEVILTSMSCKKGKNVKANRDHVREH